MTEYEERELLPNGFFKRKSTMLHIEQKEMNAW